MDCSFGEFSKGKARERKLQSKEKARLKEGLTLVSSGGEMTIC